MKKTTRKAKGGEIVVTIAKFGDDPINVTLAAGSTVSEALAEAGISVTGREQAFVEGEQAEPSDVLENADILSIVTPKSAG